MVIDSSSLISLARSGLLPLLARLPIKPVILDVVEREAVEEGLTRGHADAAAIESAISSFTRVATPQEASADSEVLNAAVASGTLVANDLALGRRAHNLGVKWLRTADLIVLLVETRAMTSREAREAISALVAAGRLSEELSAEYLKELT
ncbi:MAG: hypothetical protein ABR507_11395 [Actinomycetota bacterium]|nr:hypothetical protein [Actinomycetota bacterium]